MSGGKIGQNPFCMVDLRQESLRQCQQIFPGLGEAQITALLHPDLDSVALLEFPDCMAQCRLTDIQPFRSGGNATQTIDLSQDREVLSI